MRIFERDGDQYGGSLTVWVGENPDDTLSDTVWVGVGTEISTPLDRADVLDLARTLMRLTRTPHGQDTEVVSCEACGDDLAIGSGLYAGVCDACADDILASS